MYEFKSRVRYSEALHNGKMNPVSISNYLQDCATFHSASLLRDYKYYQSIQRGWLLNGWQIDISRYPECGENILVSTWSYGFKGFYGYRNFVIRDEQNEICVRANSIWFFINTITGQPVRVPEEEILAYGQEEKLAMEYCPRKIILPEQMTPYTIHTANPYDIDTNGHVNNARYIELALQTLPKQLLDKGHIMRIRTEYKKAAMSGDEILPQLGTLPIINSSKEAHPDVLSHQPAEYIIHLTNNTSDVSFACVAFSITEAKEMPSHH